MIKSLSGLGWSELRVQIYDREWHIRIRRFRTMDMDETIVIQGIVQEMRGLEQISQVLCTSRDMSASDIDDAWYVMQVMIHNWRETLGRLLP